MLVLRGASEGTVSLLKGPSDQGRIYTVRDTAEELASSSLQRSSPFKSGMETTEQSYCVNRP